MYRYLDLGVLSVWVDLISCTAWRITRQMRENLLPVYIFYSE